MSTEIEWGIGHWLQVDLGLLTGMLVQGDGYGYLHAQHILLVVCNLRMFGPSIYLFVLFILCSCGYSSLVHRVANYWDLGIYTVLHLQPYSRTRIPYYKLFNTTCSQIRLHERFS